MPVFEQSYTLDKFYTGELINNQVIYADNLTITPATTRILQLKGNVYAGSLQNPVNGATIVVYNPNNEAVATDVTRNINSQDGSYLVTFNGTYDSIYGVTAIYSGYDSANQNITFSSSEASTLNFTLGVNSEQNTIYGIITDVSGVPIANASVVIWSETTIVSVKSGDDGAYISYADYQPGDQRVITASKFGYASQTQPVIFPQSTSLEQNFTLQLNPLENYTTITGQVVAAGGSQIIGIANALVGLYQVNTAVTPNDENLIATMLTDAYGYYAFANIPSGVQYLVRASKVDEKAGS